MSVIVSSEFDKYRIQYYTGFTANKLAAIIFCKLSKNNVGILQFIKDGHPLPVNEVTSNGSILLNFNQHSIPEVINILQNEKPLFIHLNTHSKGGWIQTLDEEAGEEES